MLVAFVYAVREVEWQASHFRLFTASVIAFVLLVYIINLIVNVIKWDRAVNVIPGCRRRSILFGNLDAVASGIKRGLEPGEGD